MALTGREKATIFLSILGADTSARVLRYLPDELADLIASGINHLPQPSPQALEEVMAEFKSFVALPEAAPTPRLTEKPAPPPRPKKSYSVLMYERPQLVAYILSLLAPEEQQEALAAMPKDRAAISELLASLKKNPLSAKIEQALRTHFKEKLFS